MLFKKNLFVNKTQYYHKHVILFIIDGLTSNVIKKIKPEKIFASNKFNYAINLSARTVLPALAAPNIASIITGAPLEFHAIDTFTGVNKAIKPVISNNSQLFPTLFWHCQNNELSNFLFTQNKKILNFIENNSINKTVFNKNFNPEVVAKEINQLTPNFNCLYLNQLSEIGKISGFESKQYQEKTMQLFTKINNLITLINFKIDTVFIIASTFGGIGIGNTSIGGISDQEILIPHLIFGNKVKKQKIANYYSQTDLAMTIATILNFDLPQATRSRIITDLF